MPNTDIRIQVTFPAHWKTRKLEYLLGEAGPKYLIYLWCYAGVSKPLGDFSGMTDEEIEASAFWPGESGKLIEGLIESGYLNGEKGERKLHDWKEHNGWAYGFPSRSERNRKNRVKPVKEKHKVVKENGKSVKEFAKLHGDGNGKVTAGNGDGNADDLINLVSSKIPYIASSLQQEKLIALEDRLTPDRAVDEFNKCYEWYQSARKCIPVVAQVIAWLEKALVSQDGSIESQRAAYDALVDNRPPSGRQKINVNKMLEEQAKLETQGK